MTLTIHPLPLLLALMVGGLFAVGTFLILRREQIKLILGLGLISHGVNLLLFGSGSLTRGAPPILDETGMAVEIGRYADPLPQALILTAIVISFGITAFIVVLVSRRDALTGSDVVPGEVTLYLSATDPFGTTASTSDEDYDLRQIEFDQVYDQRALEQLRRQD